MASTHVFTKKEEVANAIIHGIGAVLSVIALVALIIAASESGTAWHVTSFTIYGVTMLLLYVSSTLVHSFPEGRVKDIFEICDHASIYLFIAGTYTPFLFLVVKGALGWTLFGIVWGMALIGVVFKLFFTKKFLYLSTVLYILMGWLIIFAWKPLVTSLPTGGLVLLVTGGVLYTIGAVFYVWRMFPFHHAVWHVFVLAGTVTHFFGVFYYLLP
ncbi:PAQR family membrane homeostasis protein TrhA [Aneurinibacillus migulanus]|uniref:Hemolysin D n=1 Tax=Aneurinibacillus migulanus TaxID=47500 RepID=A0A0D1YE42_ANEMI|nr:hemolysin III family protein [Aneurinibacillus migulanus]KIV57242.1 hemolysin D [Aneurinibacillus migulanus]KON96863.1 hemolysin D [Aneurinibacillus migulanus]MED0895231.1 hemolysin III family protein [Aneurinibacillus migulanus]MED1619449.1 hemolysin III family protein [Aneurinibacillus migulanus]SDJ57448.1 hemolysin III [Aneurinibacillus migulanus]